MIDYTHDRLLAAQMEIADLKARCLKLEAALRKIAAFDPGVFRPLADEIEINNIAVDALKGGDAL